MKKFIALVLSLVMALSLCAPAWGMLPVDGGVEDTVKPALPVAKMTPLGSDYEIDTTGSKLGEDFGVFALDTAYQFEPTESVEEAQASYYRYWHADFVVYSDKDVPDGSMALAGYYDAWCSLNNYKWVALTNAGFPIGANEEVRLVYSMADGGISVNYEELCNYGNDGTGFQCGVADVTGKNAGSTITVELRLYETEEPSEANGNSHNVETGNYEIIGTYSYTFGPVAMIGDSEYDTLQGAVDAAENGDVITVMANGLSATVNTSKFFTVEYADGVTKKATITEAEGYALSENNGTYTVKKLFNVTFDANGGSGELTIAPMVETKFVLPKCPFAAPEGKEFKAWSVDGKEYAAGAAIDVAADVTIIAVWKDAEKCTGDSHLKIVVEYSGDKATKVYCDSCGVTLAFVQGTEDDAENKFGAGNYKNAEKDVWYSLKAQIDEAPAVPPAEDEPVEDAPTVDVEKPVVDVTAPEVSVDTTDMTTEEKEVAEVLKADDAVMFDKAAEEALEAVAESVEVKNEVTEDTAVEALKTAEIEVTAEDTVTVVVQPYYDIKVENIDVDSNSGSVTVELDITPMYKTVVTTAANASDIVLDGDDKNAVVVGEAKKLEKKIETAVEITIAIPEALADLAVDNKLYVTHEAESGTYVYDAVVTNVGEDGPEAYFITFTNPHGFSAFTIDNEDNTVAMVDGDKYTKLSHAVSNVPDGGTIIVMKDGLQATVTKAKTFKLELADGVTELPTINVADGLKLTKNRITGEYIVTVKTDDTTTPHHPSAIPTPDEPVVKSADTFDAGIALYVGMSVAAAVGGAIVIGKKKEF